LQIFNETVYSQYFLVLQNDLDTLKGWKHVSVYHQAVPYDIFKKLEWVDMIAVTETGLNLLALEDLTRCRARFVDESSCAWLQGCQIGRNFAYLGKRLL
jgi:hypothetical protein